MSPSLWWNDEAYLAMLKADAQWKKSARVWLDIGTLERAEVTPQRVVECVRELADSFGRVGRVQGRDYRYLEVPGAGHNERAWAQRLDQVFAFLLGK